MCTTQKGATQMLSYIKHLEMQRKEPSSKTACESVFNSTREGGSM